MLTSLGIFVALAEAKINHVAQITLRPITHEKVVRLHISVKEVIVVHVL